MSAQTRQTTLDDRTDEPTETDREAEDPHVKGIGKVLWDADPDTPFHELYERCLRRGLVQEVGE